MDIHQSTTLYLDLMKRCVPASIYDENAWYVLGTLDRNQRSARGFLKSLAVKFAGTAGFLLVKPNRPKDTSKANWGLLNYTMIGMPRLNNIQHCIEDVLRNNIEGDFIETGVWRGGATIFMRAVLKAHGVTNRVVWVADSFEGLPRYTKDQTSYDGDTKVNVSAMNDAGHFALAVSLDQVKENFSKFGLLDDQVRFLKGWFSDTLPTAPIKKLSILRLDGDMYQSTMDAFNSLYTKVSKGGYVIVDDYNAWPHCRQAVDDFRRSHKIDNALIKIDDHAVYWQV
jgi:Macrocin-O-methyltransferase (TylF)